MALKMKPSRSEMALLEVIEDEVWLGEFLRSTADGSIKKEEWPKRKWEYRWYQKDILTDKNELITFAAARAVGKCSPASARIYTVQYGYITINELIVWKSKSPISVWTLDPKTKNLIQSRAKIQFNATEDVFEITTRSGHVFKGTRNHPILTPDGFVNMEDLDAGDEVAVLTKLPPTIALHDLTWAELRWLGYMIARDNCLPEKEFKVKFQRQIAELQLISNEFNTNFKLDGDRVKLMRKRGVFKHYSNALMDDIGMFARRNDYRIIRLPIKLKQQSNESIKVMLEAYLSSKLEVTPNSAWFEQRGKTAAYDMQELLLRFGIETSVKMIQPSDTADSHPMGLYKIELLDDNAYYRLFSSFDIPGIKVKNLEPPLEPESVTPFMRFEPIAIKTMLPKKMRTYAVSVLATENYISDNVLVHNSVIMEDKLIYETVNSRSEFPETKEQTLVTANVSQMTPILDRVVSRFSVSPFLKQFLKESNRSKGTLDFRSGTSNYRLNARIAGSRGENNMVPIPNMQRIRPYM